MGVHRLINNMVMAEKLPLGHYDREKTAKAVREHYRACQEQVQVVKNSMIRNVQTAADLAGDLCRKVGARPIKMLYFNSSKVPAGAGACYDPSNKTIHSPYPYIFVRALIHELAHHLEHEGKFFGKEHGEEFMICQEMLIEAYRK